MKLKWSIDASDATAVRAIIRAQRNNPFVLSRVERNVDGPVPKWSRARFWSALVACLLTTQQRSGPGSSVIRFLSQRPNPLSLSRMRRERSPGGVAQKVLTRHRGIRRASTIGTQIARNLDWLDSGGWSDIEYSADALAWYRSRRPAPDARVEESLAAYVAMTNLYGIGPKQARNLWQILGLTRYEIPIDSRITKWLNEHGFPFQIAGTSLSDPAVYSVVSDAVQGLCARARVLPCVLDAAIFSSFDVEEWSEQQLKAL